MSCLKRNDRKYKQGQALEVKMAHVGEGTGDSGPGARFIVYGRDYASADFAILRRRAKSVAARPIC